jgi:hypothetical protein
VRLSLLHPRILPARLPPLLLLLLLMLLLLRRRLLLLLLLTRIRAKPTSMRRRRHLLLLGELLIHLTLTPPLLLLLLLVLAPLAGRPSSAASTALIPLENAGEVRVCRTAETLRGVRRLLMLLHLLLWRSVEGRRAGGVDILSGQGDGGERRRRLANAGSDEMSAIRRVGGAGRASRRWSCFSPSSVSCSSSSAAAQRRPRGRDDLPVRTDAEPMSRRRDDLVVGDADHATSMGGCERGVGRSCRKVLGRLTRWRLLLRVLVRVRLLVARLGGEVVLREVLLLLLLLIPH